jgi:hypothetical protein
MSYLHGADAAFAANIPPGFDIAFGYYGGPNAYHVWNKADWARFPGTKVPVWVGGFNGDGEGTEAVKALRALTVPRGAITVLDMETRVDKTYVTAFGGVLHDAGYRTWVYGSAATVFGNPQLNGYWVADYTGQPFMHSHLGARATQYAADLPPGFDASLVKEWTAAFMWGRLK